jgi:hypothetical protein
LVPAIWGVHRGLRIPKMKFSFALIVALVLSVMILRWNGQNLMLQNTPHALINWAMSVPAWYLAFTAWKRRQEPQVEQAA